MRKYMAATAQGTKAVFLKEMGIHARDPALLVLLIVAPLLLILFLGNALGGAFAVTDRTPDYILVKSEGSERIVRQLGAPSKRFSRERALDAVRRGDVAFAVMTEGSDIH